MRMNTFTQETKNRNSRKSFLLAIKEKKRQQSYIDFVSKDLKPFVKLIDAVRIVSLIKLKALKMRKISKVPLSQSFYQNNYLSSDEEQVRSNKKKVEKSNIFMRKKLEGLVKEEIRILTYRVSQIINLKNKDIFLAASQKFKMKKE